MNDQLVYEMKSKLLDYLAKRISLKEFQSWFAPAAWATQDEEAGRLASGIELNLAEYTSGHLSESELRDEFWPLIKDQFEALERESEPKTKYLYYQYQVSGRAPERVVFQTKGESENRRQALGVRIGR